MAEIWGTLLAYLSPSQTLLFHTTALLVDDPLRRGVDTHVILRNAYDWGVRSFLLLFSILLPPISCFLDLFEARAGSSVDHQQYSRPLLYP